MEKIKKVINGPNSGLLKPKTLVSREKSAKCENKGPTILTAVVDAKGKLIRGCYAVSAKRIGKGYYEVIFSRNVRRGAYIATIGSHLHEGVPAPGEINVIGRYGKVNGVFISTSDSDGNKNNMGFHLAVFCPEGFAY